MNASSVVRNDWTLSEVMALFELPLDSLCEKAATIHKEHAAQDVQKCVLLSVKTGACPEDCRYCSQSAHYQTEVSGEALMSVDRVREAAQKAKDEGASRFCMGAAWRDVPSDARFEQVLQMVESVSGLGLEVCCTLGMATEGQIRQMKEKGLTAYNHNLDTSREFYSNVVSTRKYEERLETLAAVRKAGVQVCCGGILGMGESMKDRASMLTELATMDPHPESVPVNFLVPIEGTPLADQEQLSFEDFLRTVAAARILMPKSRVRLSAGRGELSEAQQIQCFKVGANSIFAGDKLLTTPNVDWEEDKAMFQKLSPEQHYSQSRPNI